MKLRIKAFTLVELLLAITLFSIIVVGIYSSLATGLRIHKRAGSLGGEYRDLGLMFHHLAKDLRSAVAMNGIYLVEESQGLYFYSQQYQPGGSWGLFKITYSWDRAADYWTVYRLKETYLDSLQKEHGKGEEILSEINQLDFLYGYVKATDMQESEFEWKDSWEEKAFPRMVCVKARAGEESLQKVIYYPAGIIAEVKDIME